MPIHVFNESIEATVSVGYEKTLLQTGQTAHDFYNAAFRKYQKHQSTQSLSVDEIFAESKG